MWIVVIMTQVFDPLSSSHRVPIQTGYLHPCLQGACKRSGERLSMFCFVSTTDSPTCHILRLLTCMLRPTNETIVPWGLNRLSKAMDMKIHGSTYGVVLAANGSRGFNLARLNYPSPSEFHSRLR